MNSIFIIVRTTDTAAASATTPTPLRLPSRALSVPDPSRPGSVPGRFTKRAIALLLACVVVGGAAGAGGAAAYQQITKPDTVVYQASGPRWMWTRWPTQQRRPAHDPRAAVRGQPGLLRGHHGEYHREHLRTDHTSAASGSGFVLTQDGYIVNNYHVIEDAVDDSSVSIEVSFADGTQYTATLVGGEQDNDVAVLKIDATGLQPVTLGDSDQLVVGETVYTIGNPLGELTLLPH